MSEIGSRITREGLPLGAVMMMGVTPLTMSGLSLATQLPASLLGIWIGMWVDRLRRRPLMAGSDLARAMLLMIIPVAFVTHHLQLWMFYAIAGLCGIGSLVFDSAYQAYLPWLLGRAQLSEANQKLGVTASTAEVIGPGLTGVLVQILTAPIAIAFDALSYLASACFILAVGKREPRQRRANEADEIATVDGDDDGEMDEANGMGRTDQEIVGFRDWRREIADGWHAIRTNGLLLAPATVAATYGFASSSIFVLDTLYAIRTLHLTAFLFGITVTMGGVGSLIGAALAKRVIHRFGAGSTMILTLLVQGLAATGWVWAGGPVWRSVLFLLAAQLFGDSSGMIYGILDNTLRQTIVADSLLGRVNATVRAAEVGCTAIGALVSGLLGQIIGIRDTMLLSALAMICTTLLLILSPVRTLRNIEDLA